MNITKNLILTPYRVYDNGTKVDKTIEFEAYGYRTLWQIIQSCLLTIFACTWITIHPNIPPHRCRPARIYYKVQLWLVALVMPELLLLWAAKQRLKASSLANGPAQSPQSPKETGEGGPREVEGAPLNSSSSESHSGEDEGTLNSPGNPADSPLSSEKGSNTRGWTKTQAFFALMGGFEDQAGRTLSPAGVNDYCIEMPTDEEILDKSKRDTLVKLLALAQTVWFIVVTIYRLQSQILFATEIEIITVTFAVLSAITNLFWWDKPQDVDLPLPPFRIPTLEGDYPEFTVNSGPPNCFQIASSILRSDGLQGKGEDDFIYKSDIYAFNGRLPPGKMTIAVLIASFFGSLSGASHIIFASYGGLSPTRNLVWFSLALLTTSLLLVAFFSSLMRVWIKAEEVEGFLHRALKLISQVALMLAGIGRICLIGALAYFMFSPYDEGAYLIPRWSRYILHPF